MDMMCSRCKKRVAVVYVSKLEDGKFVNQGLCLPCARDMGIPQVQEMVDRFGISGEELKTLSDQMTEMMQGGEEGFDMGGAMSLPNMLQSFLETQHPQEGAEDALAETEEDAEDEPSELAVLPEEKEESSAPRRKKEKRKKRKYLDQYCENLTVKARNGGLDAIIGRDREIYRVMQILNRRQKNNPCLIGEPGVGKTAIAEGIAQRLANGNVPPRLAEKELYLLDLTALVAGTQFRGQFESRVKGLVEDIKEAGNVILFIDEMHNLIGAGDAEGSMNAANILKPALSRGEIQVIGATTFAEYRKHIEKDAALERRFQPVTVNEPTIADTVAVLCGIKKYYEAFHRVKISDEIARLAAEMSERYITDRYLPDKAIDLLDEACSCCTLDNEKLFLYEEKNRQYADCKREEAQLQQEAEIDFAKMATLRSSLLRLEAEIQALEPEALGQPITAAHLAQVIELWTGIPAKKIQETEAKKVLGLADALRKRIIGQDEAVDLVAKAIRRTRIQLSPKRRPASFLFVGPTGVGKTELVRRLSEELFDGTEPMIRLDMSEYMEKHSVSRMVGSPPGYVGYDEAGQLTEKVRRRPYSVVLFDEIEKAHPDVLNILLQILDEGKVTDAQGRVVSFENTVIVMTSNAGSNQKGGAVGFDKTVDDLEKEKVMKALTEFLRPELIARIDEIVVFRPLTKSDYERIAALLLEEWKIPLHDRGVQFGYDAAALSLIAEKAFGQKAGARDIRRVLRREVEDAITLALLEASPAPSLLQVTAAEGEIRLLTE